MKRIILIFTLALSTIFTLNAQTLEQKWDEANTMYINGNYERAISIYDSIIESGSSSHKIYYNLGNAYFKEGKIGKAILYYNKALRLSPSDIDTKHNLEVAGTYVKDKIESVPEFFVNTWIRELRQSMSSNTWAILSLVMLAVALALVLLYLLSKRFLYRKIGFFGAIGMLAICIFAICSASIEKSNLVEPTEAVVTSSAVPVKSSPNKLSKDIFVLHEGTKVKVVGQLQEWREVTIADGNKGWILATSIEMI